MKFWIPPLNEEQLARTKLHHTARGVSWYIKQGPRAKHPLAFSWALGLQSIDWYSSPSMSLYHQLKQEVLIAVASYWRGRLEDLDLPMLALRFGCLHSSQHELAVQLMTDELLLPKEHRMKRVDTIPPDVLDLPMLALQDGCQGDQARQAGWYQLVSFYTPWEVVARRS